MILLKIIGMAAFGHMAADFLSQFDRLPSKPFKCNMCLTFWLSIGPLMLLDGASGFLMASTAAIVSELIYKLLTRI